MSVVSRVGFSGKYDVELNAVNLAKSDSLFEVNTVSDGVFIIIRHFRAYLF